MGFANTGTPANLSLTAARGSSEFLARHDHVHQGPSVDHDHSANTHAGGGANLSVGTTFAWAGEGDFTDTGTQNNLTPSNWSSLTVFQWKGGSGLTVTGLTAQGSGAIKVIHHAGTGLLIFNHEDTNSSSFNRITLPRTAILTLAVGDTVVFEYNNDSQRWVPIAFTTARIHDHTSNQEGGTLTASGMAVSDTGGFYATDTVAAMFQSLGPLVGHETDASDAHDATAISVADAGGHYVGTEVETVLDEIGDEINSFQSHSGTWHTYAGFKVNDGANTQNLTVVGGMTTVAWSAEEWDGLGGFDLTTETYTVPTGYGGLWLFNAQVEYDNSTHGNRLDLTLRVNGASRSVFRTVLHAVTGGAHAVLPPTLLVLSAGDTVLLAATAPDEAVTIKGTAIQSWFSGMHVADTQQT
jgi:hypothetical protein